MSIGLCDDQLWLWQWITWFDVFDDLCFGLKAFFRHGVDDCDLPFWDCIGFAGDRERAIGRFAGLKRLFGLFFGLCEAFAVDDEGLLGGFRFDDGEVLAGAAGDEPNVTVKAVLLSFACCSDRTVTLVFACLVNPKQIDILTEMVDELETR